MLVVVRKGPLTGEELGRCCLRCRFVVGVDRGVDVGGGVLVLTFCRGGMYGTS